MNSNDLDRNLNEWFDAVEPRNEPQQILTNVFAVTRRTGQRRGIAGRLATILPLERVLNATFEGMRKRRQHVGGRTLPGRLSVPRFVTALGGAAAVLIVAVVAFGLYVNQPGISGLATPSPAAQSPAAQQPSPSPSIKPTISGSMWPQSTLEEVQAAQELADAGDRAYRWQVDPGLEILLSQGGPYHSRIFNRFLEEELGWEEFRWRLAGTGAAHGDVVFIRCASGRANPIYPDEPANDRCAPTIDEFRYETVQINVAQPVRQDDTGIWVVTAWEMVEPFEQVAPLSEAEVTELLNGFLQARIDGEGAEEYVRVLVDGPEIPFLYATPDGAPYERYEFEVANGPTWPNGTMRLRVRLFAEDGDTVVEQLMLLERSEQGLWYESYSHWVEPGPGTTVNGHPQSSPQIARIGREVLRFTGDRSNGVGDLIAVDPETGDSRVLVEGLADIAGASWSADGKWIAYKYTNGILKVVGPDGVPRQLAGAVTGDRVLWGFAWSPDGAQLSYRGDVYDAWTGLRTEGHFGLAVSPDGTKSLYGASGGAIYSDDVGTRERSLLVQLPGEDLETVDGIEWSPDGSRLAILNDLNPGFHRLFVLNADGSDIRVLAEDAAVEGWDWSPDGTRLAFAESSEVELRIWVAPANGSTVTLVGSQPNEDEGGDPVWSPDGSRIAFWTEPGEAFVIDADGSGDAAPLDALAYEDWRGGWYACSTCLFRPGF